MFEIGQSYENNIGTFKVLAIHNDIIEVCYFDGHTQKLSIAIQSRIQANRTLTQSIEQNYIPKSSKLKEHTDYGYSDYWTLGFLLARLTYLQYKVQYDNRDKARDNYFNATGEELDTVETGIFYYPKDTNQWGNQGVITFRANESELHLLKFNSKPSPTNSPNVYIVSNIHYLHFMLENGFKLGGHTDKIAVASKIPTVHQATFNKGVEYGLRL